MQYRVWYMKPGFFRDGMMGFDWLDGSGKLPDPADLGKTHVELKTVEASDLEQVFYQMQGEVWSPRGEARGLIASKGLQHTSMSVGDVAVYSETLADGRTVDHVMMVDTFGFKEVYR